MRLVLLLALGAASCVSVEPAAQPASTSELVVGAGCGQAFVAFADTADCPADIIDLDCNAIQTLPEGEEQVGEVAVHLDDGRGLPDTLELSVANAQAGVLAQVGDALASGQVRTLAGGTIEVCLDISVSGQGPAFEQVWELSASSTSDQELSSVNSFVRFF